MVRIHHQFVQSQLIDSCELYENDIEQIQNSAGSCEAEEVGEKSARSKFRQGPHEGIKNQNYKVTDFEESKPTVLGKLLSRKPN